MNTPRFSRGRIVIIATLLAALSGCSVYAYANHRFREPPDDLAFRDTVEWGLPVGSEKISDTALEEMADAQEALGVLLSASPCSRGDHVPCEPLVRQETSDFEQRYPSARCRSTTSGQDLPPIVVSSFAADEYFLERTSMIGRARLGTGDAESLLLAVQRDLRRCGLSQHEALQQIAYPHTLARALHNAAEARPEIVEAQSDAIAQALAVRDARAR